jgi:hypothetical protein
MSIKVRVRYYDGETFTEPFPNISQARDAIYAVKNDKDNPAENISLLENGKIIERWHGVLSVKYIRS